VTLAALLSERSVVLCCGAGGAGKTTTAAALALAGAHAGRRTVVVTIDPARRLADALGLAPGELGNEPRRLDLAGVAAPGELWASMLDAKATFDEVVRTHAPDAAQAERILANRFYRNISGALSGTQEYMAMERLHELHESDRWDLVVVDTPPSRHALDAFDAPGRLVRFLDHRLYRTLVGAGRGPLRALNLAAQVFVRTAARVVGTEVLDDAVAFFRAFDGMEAGFRDRAAAVVELLGSPATAVVLVAPPTAAAATDAGWFAGRLREQGLAVGALVVNRLHPDLGGHDAAARAAALAGTDLGEQFAALAEHQAVVDDEHRNLAALELAVRAPTTATVPLLEGDVHDLAGLGEVAAHLFGAPGPRLPSQP
jgi:anion-transporting  ArsA/GET3 family ATPase